MKTKAVACEKDIEDFFCAFNQHNWDTVFTYMSEDCIWDASERRLRGRQEMIAYWTKDHSAFAERLSKPDKVLFQDNMVYLQTKIHLDFIQDSIFCGKAYRKGEALDFTCVDFYELDNEGKIKSGIVFTKFPHS